MPGAPAGRSVETQATRAADGQAAMAFPQRKAKEMSISSSTATWRAGAGAMVLLLAFAVASPASAKQDPGTTGGIILVPSNQQCAMERIGPQLIRCDSLTGTGVVAPSWVTER